MSSVITGSMLKGNATRQVASTGRFTNERAFNYPATFVVCPLNCSHFGAICVNYSTERFKDFPSNPSFHAAKFLVFDDQPQNFY